MPHLLNELCFIPFHSGNVGLLYMQTGKFELADKFLKASLQIQPNNKGYEDALTALSEIRAMIVKLDSGSSFSPAAFIAVSVLISAVFSTQTLLRMLTALSPLKTLLKQPNCLINTSPFLH